MAAFKGKIKKNLGLCSIIASSFFLFNPDIAIIDIIPDVFGYLLLIAGISQLSEINEKIADALGCFKKAAICNAVKFGLIVVLFGMVTPREFPVSMLLFTFVMNLLDIIFLIPGYINLFGGLIYLGERLDGSFVLARKRFIPQKCPEGASAKKQAAFEKKELKRRLRCERSLSNTEKFRKSTIIFVIFKALTPVLPEFTSLLSYEYSDSLINYYDFIFLYRSIAVIIMFFVGVCWLISATKYYFGLMKDRAFISALKDKYANEILPNKVYFAKKFSYKAAAFFIVSSFFCIKIYFDDYNIVPGVIAAILFALASIYIRTYSSRWKLCFVGASIMGIGSVLLEISRYRFNYDYIKEQVMKNPSAYSAWEKMFFYSFVECFGMLIVVVSIVLISREIIKKYTGYFMQGSDAFDPERATRELHHELSKPLLFTLASGVLSAICVPFYFFAMPIRFEAVWFFDLVFSLCFSFSFMQNLIEITKHINFVHFLGDE